MNIPGIINSPCKASVSTTVARLEALFKTHGLKVFARIDQAEEAKAVGLTMRPMVLLIFGNPKTGIPFLLEHLSIAIDVPFRALVWESEEGLVWLTYISAEFLEQRHGLQNSPFGGMVDLLEGAAKEAGY